MALAMDAVSIVIQHWITSSNTVRHSRRADKMERHLEHRLMVSDFWVVYYTFAVSKTDDVGRLLETIGGQLNGRSVALCDNCKCSTLRLYSGGGFFYFSCSVCDRF